MIGPDKADAITDFLRPFIYVVLALIFVLSVIRGYRGKERESKNPWKQLLEKQEALLRLQSSLAERIGTIKSEKEKKQLDRLARRIFDPERCVWDEENRAELLALLAEPQSVGATFKLRDRIHRIFCKVK